MDFLYQMILFKSCRILSSLIMIQFIRIESAGRIRRDSKECREGIEEGEMCLQGMRIILQMASKNYLMIIESMTSMHSIPTPIQGDQCASETNAQEHPLDFFKSKTRNNHRLYSEDEVEEASAETVTFNSSNLVNRKEETKSEVCQLKDAT